MGSGALEGKVVRVVVVMVVVEVKVSRRRRRSCGSVGMAKGKLEEIPDLRFGVRLGISYGHAVSSPVRETVIAEEMNRRRKRNKRIDFEQRGSKHSRLLRLLLFSGCGFENVKSVANADLRRIMNCGGEKRLTSTRFGFSFFL